MPEDAGTIYASIMLRLDKLQSGVSKVQSLMSRVEKTGKEKAAGFASFWKNSFQTAFGVGIVQLIGKVTQGLRAALNVFSGFQQSMQNVKSVTGAVGEEFKVMQEAAKEAGETTRFTAREAADALYYLGSAGFTAQQSIAALDGVLQLAGATQSDLASTAETVASIISQYSLEAEDAADVSNIFAAAIGNSQATMEKLSNAFRQVGPVAAGFGYTVEETTGALQELFNAGFQGQAAGRALKSALADLASPTENMEKIFKRLNVSLKDVNPETNSFADIIDTLAESGATTSDIIDAFGKVAGPQMAVLIEQGGDALREYTEAVTDTNAAAEAYAIQNDSLAGSLDFLKSKLESTAIAIFEKMEPGMRDLIDSFIDFLDAARPVGVVIGNILNVILKLASVSVGAVTGLFKGLFRIFGESKTPLQEASEAFKEVGKTIKEAGEISKTIQRLDDLNNRYERLTKKSNLSKKEQDELKKTINDIAKIVPNAATAFDEYGNALDINIEKSKQAARQMLDTRRAIILEAKSRLDLQVPILRNTLELYGKEAKRIKENRKQLAESALYQQQILTETRQFWNVFNKSVASGENELTAYQNAVNEMVDTFSLLQYELVDTKGNMKSLSDGIFAVNEVSRKAEKTLNTLSKTLDEENEIEIKVKDAQNKLEELANLEKELKEIQRGINNLDKIDPVDKDAPKKVDELKELTEKFWNDYIKSVEEATREARLFGDEEDALSAKLNFLKSSYLELLDKGIKPTTSTMVKLRQEYDLTLAELEALIGIEKEHTATLKDKEKIEKDLIELTESYRDKLEELETPEEDLLKFERQRAIDSVKASGATNEAITAAIDAINKYYDKLEKQSEQAKNNFKFNIDEMISAASELATSLGALYSAMADQRIAELDRQLEAELEAAGVSEETERERLEKELEAAKEAGDVELQQKLENDIKRLEIEEKFEKEKAQIQYKAELFAWQIKLTSAIAALAQAIMVATAAGPFPFNLPAIGFAVAQGVNVGAVAAAKPQPPTFDTGGVSLGSGISGPTGGYMAELHGREMVLNDDQVQNLFSAIDSGNIGNENRPIVVTAYFMLDGEITGKSVAKTQQNGIIYFKQRKSY